MNCGLKFHMHNFSVKPEHKTDWFSYTGYCQDVTYSIIVNNRINRSHPRYSHIARSYSPFDVLKEQHACWMNTYFKISLQMYRAFFKQ